MLVKILILFVFLVGWLVGKKRFKKAIDTLDDRTIMRIPRHRAVTNVL